jgi:hypothetical protein
MSAEIIRGIDFKNKRWSWVVGRLHMLDGTLPGIKRAETTRKEAQSQILSQLTQLNSV